LVWSTRRRAVRLLGLAVLLFAARAGAQELGHRVPGTLGLDAGKQSDVGLYLASQSFFYSADRARDRNGQLLPTEDLDLKLFATALGIAFTTRVGFTYFTAAVGVPYAQVKVTSAQPPVDLSRGGITDLSVMPLKLGWRWTHADAVAAYTLYVPTGSFHLGQPTGLSQGAFTHQLSLGGALYFDEAKRFYASALLSYDKNQHKIGIDITRGDNLVLQGGVGARLHPLLDLGVVTYALWQVHADAGSDIPPNLRGLWDQVYGLGPEVGVRIPPLRARLTAHLEWDFAAQSRPEGRLLLVALNFALWRPKGTAPAPPTPADAGPEG
jgi:hypothetical protein